MNPPVVGSMIGRLALGMWFVAGAILGILAARSAQTPVIAVADSPLLLRSPCSAGVAVSVWGPDGDLRGTLRLRDPALYRIPGASTADDVVIGTDTARLPSRELPLGDEGELLIPPEWCTASGAASPSPGLLGP